MRNASSRLDLLMFPKVSSNKEVIKFDELVTTMKKFKRTKKIGFEIIIETTLGLININ